jgi:hypothetical protein
MTGLDFGALEELSEELNKAGGDTLFLNVSKITEEIIRIMPPLHANMKGIYFFEEKGIWLDKVRYVSPASPLLKGSSYPCPIVDEVNKAKDSTDPSVKLLYKKLLDAGGLRSQYMMPVLQLAVTTNTKGMPVAIEAVDDNVKVLQFNKTILKAVHASLTEPMLQPEGTVWGILDMEKGYNFKISKTGLGQKNTRYGAQLLKDMNMADWLENAAELYTTDKIPDLVGMAEKKLLPDDYLRSIVRNYFYGEPKPVLPGEDAPATEGRKRSLEDDLKNS